MDILTDWALHAILPRSAANGPGFRFVVWVQGCSLGCKGCFNPETHSLASEMRPVTDVVEEVLATPGIEGVTVTGGEPLEQPAALAAFARQVRDRTKLSVIVLTGYSRDEILADPSMLEAARACDTLVCGRYNERQRLASGLRGSRNKEYWLQTSRYSERDFEHVPEAEILISPDGFVVSTGVDPILIKGAS